MTPEELAELERRGKASGAWWGVQVVALVAALRVERERSQRLRDVLTALVVECRPGDSAGGPCAPDFGVWMTAREELTT